MQLVKIYGDRIQIRSDLKQLRNTKINDLLLLSDENAKIVCSVVGLTECDASYANSGSEDYLDEFTGTNIIECSIIGSLVNGRFEKAIDVYPTTKVDITAIDLPLFEKMITHSKRTSFDIGRYASYETRAFIDGNKFFQRHSAVIGNTGSGKSFTITTMLEKVSMLKGSNVIVFDLHGEYSGLSYVKKIQFGKDTLFPFWLLSFTDIYSAFLKVKEETSTVQLSALRKAFYKARQSEESEDKPIYFNPLYFIAELERLNEAEDPTGEFYKTGDRAGQEKTTKGEYNGKLSILLNLIKEKVQDERYGFMFGESPENYLSVLMEKVLNITDKNIKVIDLSNLPHEIVPVVIGILSKLVYKMQLVQEKSKRIPLNFVCDEAHVYIPSDNFKLGASQRRLLDIFETIAKEGRKFGTSLTIVSQRPSELNKTIIAQCANFLVLKLSNANDKFLIKDILTEGSKHIIDTVSLFKPGDGIVIGDSTPIPLKIKIDKPKEEPNSNTIDFWDIWGQESTLDVDELVNRYMRERKE
jgi:DNA helicase HerA-like ATPase